MPKAKSLEELLAAHTLGRAGSAVEMARRLRAAAALCDEPEGCNHFAPLTFLRFQVKRALEGEIE